MAKSNPEFKIGKKSISCLEKYDSGADGVKPN